MTLLLWWLFGFANVMAFLWSDIRERGITIRELLACIPFGLLGPMALIIWCFHPKVDKILDIKISKGKKND